MALVDLQNISKQYDTKVILKDTNLTILQGQKIAVIGQNGQGKSTLLKIITKEIEPDSGFISIDGSISIEMLSQTPIFDEDMTVRDVIKEQLKELIDAKKEYEQITFELSIDYNNPKLIARQSWLISYLDYHNAWDLDNSIVRVMQEFKLTEYENKNISLLSGGEQRRVSLAGLILKKPDLLLLDEPTNHLDVYMVEFLEQLLLKGNFTLLFISHDRYFIDNIADFTIEVENGTLKKFQGGYSKYLEAKAKILEDMQKDHQDLLRLLKAEAHWMQRGVTARRKRNERRKAEYFKLKEEAKRNPAQIKKIQLQLQREQKSFNNGEILNKKKMLFEVENISKSLGDKVLITDFSTRILQKDTIAIVGANGTGKSTFLKILLGEIAVDKGIIKMGDFKIGYFDQHRKMLDDSKSIVEVFCPNGGDRVVLSDGRNMHVFGYLKNFLFPQEYLDKKIGVLSGGEKNRIALALLFTKKIDCLIMDEPTNDLDLPTINILEEYLQNFQGALIFVSHDRYFVDKIAKKLFIFQKNGKLIESFEPYSEYLQMEKEIDELETIAIKSSCDTTKQTKKDIQSKPKKLTYKQQKEYDSLPDLIEELEQKIKDINECLSNPNCYEQEGIIKISQKLQEYQEMYDMKMQRYFELEEMIENF
jgi:ATP-binding cassette subfamily F protein uup